MLNLKKIVGSLFVVATVSLVNLTSVNAETKIKTADMNFLDYVPFGYWHGIRVSDKLPSISAVRNITVGVKSGENVANSWKVAAQYAITHLNYSASDHGSAVHYNWTGASNADVLLEYANLHPLKIASTDIHDNNIGEKLKINPSYNGIGHSYKVGVMQHELLHAIGFLHSGTDLGISKTKDGAITVHGTNRYWDWVYAGKSITSTYGSVSEIPSYLNFIDKKALGIVFPD